MSDTSSSSRSPHPSPAPGSDGGVPGDRSPVGPEAASPIADDQPTIISGRSPIALPSVSDSACRILQGKILPGDHLEHFELSEYIGGGGMGRVFRAVDTRLGRTVALKVLPTEQATENETLLRFKNEAQSAARLDHQNIARVFYVGEDRGLHFIAFEFIDGVNIRRLVEQKGPLSLAEAVSYSLQIAEALVHAADRDVVHRDIKPSNVLITSEGHVKLIDMGLARFQRGTASAEDLTASGVTLGTFDYISPEQARDPRNADVRSDIYSLGCTFFYMLVGRPPFPEGTVLQKLLQHQGDEPPDVRQYRPELPEDAIRVLRKMLAKDPRHRYRFPSELVDDLMALAEQIGLQPVGPGGKVLVAPTEAGVSFIRRHLPWMAPIAALLCIVTVLHLTWTRQPSPPPPMPDNQARANGGLAGPQDGHLPAAATAGQDDPAEKPPPSPPDVNRSDEPRLPGRTDDPAVAAGDGNANTAGPDPEIVLPDPTRPEQPEERPQPGLYSPFVATYPATGSLAAEPVSAGSSAAGGVSQSLSVEPAGGTVSGYLSGATGEARHPTHAGPEPTPTPVSNGVLVVGDQVEGDGVFASLGAACAGAVDGDVIELHYDGRREERPIALANLNVEIRPGKGYRPVIVFRPGGPQIDPVKYPRSMFTVSAGRVTLVDVALELQLPGEIHAESWALFQTRGAPTVTLQRCSLSICKPSKKPTLYREEVAFFHVRSAPGAEVVTPEAGPASAPRAFVSLLDCIARGEAVLARVDDLQPLQVTWENGLLVTSEQLLSAGGGRQAALPGESIRVDLRHLTALVRSGLCCVANTQAAPHRAKVEIHCSDGILVAAAGSPLIEQIDGTTLDATLDDFRQGIEWTGDGNFYEGFDVFWTIQKYDREPLAAPMTFESWIQHWESTGEYRPQLGQVKFERLPKLDRPLHTHTPPDYALSKSTAEDRNPAVGAAGMGLDAGMQADRLPQPPAAAQEPAAGDPY